MAAPLVLVLGGTRSGKSSYAVSRVQELANARPICFLATAREGDPELDDRIRRHRAARPQEWRTIDVGDDLVRAMEAAGEGAAILVDGLTLWLSALAAGPSIDIDALLDGPVAQALLSIHAHEAPVVVVSDEIGLGMVPMDAYARAFRDLQGIVHQRFAAAAHEVVLTVAGLPVVLKPR